MGGRDFDVPAPLDATRVGKWENRDGHIERYFHGTRRGTQVPVQIVGLQDVDGSVIARMILVGNEQVELDLEGVHELIWVLADAGNEVERLTLLPGQDDHEFNAELFRDVD